MWLQRRIADLKAAAFTSTAHRNHGPHLGNCSVNVCKEPQGRHTAPAYPHTLLNATARRVRMLSQRDGHTQASERTRSLPLGEEHSLLSLITQATNISHRTPPDTHKHCVPGTKQSRILAWWSLCFWDENTPPAKSNKR